MSNDLFVDFPLGRFRTLTADPPWRYGDNLPGKGRGAAKHYATLTPAEIAALPIPDLAEPDAHLWLWTTNSFMADALWLAKHWGFEHKTILTWCKPQIGMGRYLRNTTEHCVLSVRGKLPWQGPLNIPSHFVAPRQQHSRKPQAAYDIIALGSPEARLEIFARETRIGFYAWGNEVERD